jgi:phosphate transport system substrate-binding protein
VANLSHEPSGGEGQACHSRVALNKTNMTRKQLLKLSAAAVLSTTILTGCGGSDEKVIQAKGSDTMIQLATAWAEAFNKTNPNIKISATGGGSGTGIAALQNGTADICNSSRKIKKEEVEKIKAQTGKDVIEHVVAIDALAIYVNNANAMEQISVEELTQVWAEGGTLETWEALGGAGGKISLVGRQNGSGTYDYFREHICGKTAEGKAREFRAGISELVGSTEVIKTIAQTPTAMGYSGMGYKNDTVKWLKVSNKKGETAVLPGEDSARDKSYPISRELFIYTVGEPTGHVKTFLDWVKSPEGQAIVSKEGFVGLK